MKRRLLIEDERTVRDALTAIIRAFGCTVVACGSASSALDAAARERFDLALVDRWVNGESGLMLTRCLLGRDPALVVAIIGADPRDSGAVEAAREGASNYLRRPVEIGQLRRMIDDVR